jgi:hypothetical protein
MTGPSRDGMASALKSLMGVSNAPDTRSKRVTKRHAIVRKSDLTNLELGQQVRERDANPITVQTQFGTWSSGKAGLGWHTELTEPRPIPMRSKKKYRPGL